MANINIEALSKAISEKETALAVEKETKLVEKAKELGIDIKKFKMPDEKKKVAEKAGEKEEEKEEPEQTPKKDEVKQLVSAIKELVDNQNKQTKGEGKETDEGSFL